MVMIKRFQGKNPAPGNQGRIHFERGIFSGGPHKGDQAVFNMKQKGILLGLVEPMDFIHKENGSPFVQVPFFLGPVNDLADILNPGQNS